MSERVTYQYKQHRYRPCRVTERLPLGSIVYCFNRPPGSETLLEPLEIMRGLVREEFTGFISVQWDNSHYQKHAKEFCLVRVQPHE